MKKQSSKKKQQFGANPPTWKDLASFLLPSPLKAVQREGMVSRSGGDADPRAVRVRRVVVPGVGRRGAAGRGAWHRGWISNGCGRCVTAL